MLPIHLAENIRQQVLYYLQSTFAFRDRKIEAAFSRFLEDPENGLFKGPWLQIRRPFRPAPEGIALPFRLAIPFHPIEHQWKSWRRLSSLDRRPEPVIVTTGTASGKTECFLYPILDHCLRMKDQKIPTSVPSRRPLDLPFLSEAVIRRAGCVNRARPDPWGAWAGDRPGLPDCCGFFPLLGPNHPNRVQYPGP